MLRQCIAVAAAFTWAAVASGQTVTIGFDHVGAPGSFKMIFPGFDNGPVLEFDDVTVTGGVILRDVLFNNTATTNPNICATCDTCFLGDQPDPTGLPGFITGEFEADVASVELDVINGSTCCSGMFTLTVFDANGVPLDSDAAQAGPMGKADQVRHLAASASGIRSFTVTTNLSKGYTFAIDTLVFQIGAGPVPAASSVGVAVLAVLLVGGAAWIVRRAAHLKAHAGAVCSTGSAGASGIRPGDGGAARMASQPGTVLPSPSQRGPA